MARATGSPIDERLAKPLQGYWLDRAARHTQDSYAGIPLSKFPRRYIDQSVPLPQTPADQAQ